jgi:hypothetical protein
LKNLFAVLRRYLRSAERISREQILHHQRVFDPGCDVKKQQGVFSGRQFIRNLPRGGARLMVSRPPAVQTGSCLEC